MNTRIEIISSESGDWEALYVNGKLRSEGHSIRPGEVLFAIQDIFPHDFECSFISDECAEEGFPELREELTDYIVD